MKHLKTLSLVFLLVVASGCCKPVVIKPVPLPLPPMKDIPAVEDKDLAPLHRDIVIRLQQRETGMWNHIDELTAIIKSTH